MKLNSYGITILLFTCFLSRAQVNLVPNGSFEENEHCPSGWGDLSVSEWYSPSEGSPDYYHPCTSYYSNVFTTNINGNQAPHSGLAYVGLINCFADIDYSNYRESIQIKLTNSLQANKKYIFSCYVSLGDRSEFCNRDISFSLSQGPITHNSYSSIYPPNPYHLSETFICDTINWVKLSYVITAQGDENFLTIGIFNDDDHVDTLTLKSSNVNCSFYYIDDVSLQEYLLEFPNVFTPNKDNLNDIWTTNFTSPDEYVIIMDRWGNTITRLDITTPNWDGNSNGRPCSDGVYFYKAYAEEAHKNGFIHLIR